MKASSSYSNSECFGQHLAGSSSSPLKLPNDEENLQAYKSDETINLDEDRRRGTQAKALPGERRTKRLEGADPYSEAAHRLAPSSDGIRQQLKHVVDSGCHDDDQNAIRIFKGSELIGVRTQVKPALVVDDMSSDQQVTTPKEHNEFKEFGLLVVNANLN